MCTSHNRLRWRCPVFGQLYWFPCVSFQDIYVYIELVNKWTGNRFLLHTGWQGHHCKHHTIDCPPPFISVSHIWLVNLGSFIRQSKTTPFPAVERSRRRAYISCWNGLRPFVYLQRLNSIILIPNQLGYATCIVLSLFDLNSTISRCSSTSLRERWQLVRTNLECIYENYVRNCTLLYLYSYERLTCIYSYKTEIILHLICKFGIRIWL